MFHINIIIVVVTFCSGRQMTENKRSGISPTKLWVLETLDFYCVTPPVI